MTHLLIAARQEPPSDCCCPAGTYNPGNVHEPYCPMSEPQQASTHDLPQDWADALDLADLWSQYWEDDPIVHMDCGQVGMLARSFLFAMAHFGVIAKPGA